MRLNNRYGLGVIVSLCALLSASEAYAADGDNSSDDVAEARQQIHERCRDDNRNSRYPSACHERSRLTAFEPNYAVWRFAPPETDKESLRVHYSFRFLFTEPDCMSKYRNNETGAVETQRCLKEWSKRKELFFTYSGEFDFYLGTRPSGPVINRLSNPALHTRFNFDDTHPMIPGAPVDWLDVSLEHRSNGQVIDANEKVTDAASLDYGKYRAQVEWEKGNRAYIDAISRSVNYLTLGGRFSINFQETKKLCSKGIWLCMDLWFNWKALPLFNKAEESDVTWGPYANLDRHIADYDRFRLILSKSFAPGMIGLKVFSERIEKIEFDLEWIAGNLLEKTDAINASVLMPVAICGARIPFYVRYHRGPMDTFSDFTQSVAYWSAGFELR